MPAIGVLVNIIYLVLFFFDGQILRSRIKGIAGLVCWSLLQSNDLSWLVNVLFFGFSSKITFFLIVSNWFLLSWLILFVDCIYWPLITHVIELEVINYFNGSQIFMYGGFQILVIVWPLKFSIFKSFNTIVTY